MEVKSVNSPIRFADHGTHVHESVSELKAVVDKDFTKQSERHVQVSTQNLIFWHYGMRR